VLRTNEMVTMLEAAAADAGLALLPCMLADADPRLVRLTPQLLVRRGLSLVYRLNNAAAVQCASWPVS
jgi:DNA-binding transcriptional LysR family regulator